MMFPDSMNIVGKLIYFTSFYKQYICLRFNFVSKASLQFVIIVGIFLFGCHGLGWMDIQDLRL